MDIVVISLQLFRAVSITMLLWLVIACIVMDVWTVYDAGYRMTAFFQYVCRTCTALVSLTLIVIDIGIPRKVLTRVMGPPSTRSWTIQGVVQCIVSVLVLSRDPFVEAPTSAATESVSVNAVLGPVPGWTNLICGMVYVCLGVVGGVSLRIRRDGYHNDDDDVMSQHKSVMKPMSMPMSVSMPMTPVKPAHVGHVGHTFTHTPVYTAHPYPTPTPSRYSPHIPIHQPRSHSPWSVTEYFNDAANNRSSVSRPGMDDRTTPRSSDRDRDKRTYDRRTPYM